MDRETVSKRYAFRLEMAARAALQRPFNGAELSRIFLKSSVFIQFSDWDVLNPAGDSTGRNEKKPEGWGILVKGG